MWDSQGGAWYIKVWDDKKEAEEVLDMLVASEKAERNVLDVRKVG